MIRPGRRRAHPVVHEDVRAYSRAAIAAGLLPALLPAQAAARSEVRVVHGVPGAGRGELDVLRGASVRPVEGARFGQVSPYAGIRSGPTRLGLSVGGAQVAVASTRLAPRAHYTVLAIPGRAQVSLRVLRDGSARRGVARLRMVHAAPELGSPDLVFDGRRVARGFAYGAVSPYLAVRPGRHSAAAMRPGSGRAVLRVGRIPLPAGSASTAFVLGSRGEAVRVALARDARTAREHGRPAPRRRRGRAVHVVRHGESLWGIAVRRAGVRANTHDIVRELRRLWVLNEGRVSSGNPDVIPPGLRLRLA